MVVTCFSGRVAQTTWDAARGSGEDVDDGDEEEEVMLLMNMVIIWMMSRMMMMNIRMIMMTR